MGQSYPDEPVVSASGFSGAGQQNWCSTVWLLQKVRGRMRGSKGAKEEERQTKDSKERTVCHLVITVWRQLFALCPYSPPASLPVFILSSTSQRSWRGSHYIVLDYFHRLCLQFGTGPWANALCRSVQGWQHLCLWCVCCVLACMVCVHGVCVCDCLCCPLPLLLSKR